MQVWVGVNYRDLIPGNGVATTSGMFNKSAEAEKLALQRPFPEPN